MLPPTTILDDEDQRVAEGSSHRYRCTLAEEDGSPLQVAAITAITGWLKVHASSAVINARDAVALLALNGGSVAEVVVDGVTRALFTWQFDPADAVISTAGQTAGLTRERHRITLKFAYTKAGGGAGQLTKRVLYDVESLEDI